MNIKLNKIAENRLNEKEMRSLKGGADTTSYEWNVVCNRDGVCCEAMCSCTYHPPLLDPVSSTGESGATSSQHKLA
jgi:natural product precursor